MTILDIIKKELIGKKLIGVGKNIPFKTNKKELKNAVIINVFDLNGWEDSGYMYDSGVLLTLEVEFDFRKSRNTMKIQINGDDDLVLGE